MPFISSKDRRKKRRRVTAESHAVDSRSYFARLKLPRPKRIGKTRITESSGNVFFDVGFPPHEANSFLMRADLMFRLQHLIKARRLKPPQAAKLLGVTQPRISDLMRHKYNLFSIETL